MHLTISERTVRHPRLKLCKTETPINESECSSNTKGVAHCTFFCSRQKSQMELCTHCTNATPFGTTAQTHTPFLGRCCRSVLPGVSTPPPCEESVKMPARSHLGEANPVAPDGPASVSRQARGAHPWREHNGMQPAGRRGQVQIILLIVQNGKQASQDKEGWRRSDWRISPLLFFPLFSPFKHRKFHFAIFHLTASISQGVWFWYSGIESFAFYSGVWITAKYTRPPHPPSPHPPLIFNLTQATMSAHCSKISTLFHFCFHSSGY